MFFKKITKQSLKRASDEITGRVTSGIFRILSWTLSVRVVDALAWEATTRAANSGGLRVLESIGYAGNQKEGIRFMFSNRLRICAERHGDPRMREMATNLLGVWDRRYGTLEADKNLSRSEARKSIGALRTAILTAG
jgi:hypothetical protein